MQDKKKTVQDEQSNLRAVEDQKQLSKNSHNPSDIKSLKTGLQDLEVWHRALFNNANDAIFLMDYDRFIDCNPKTLDMFGCTREQIIGQTPYDRFSPRFQPDGQLSKNKALEKIRLALEGKPQLFEWRHLRYDGTIFETEVSLNRVKISENFYLQAFVRDITKQKHAHLQYETILKTTMDGFCLLDSRGRILEVNDAFCSLVGYTREELLSMNLADVEAVESADDIKKHIKKLMDYGSHRFKTRHKRKDGRILHLEVSANNLQIDGDRVFAFFRDITESEQSEQALQESEMRYRSLFENMPAVCFTFDRSGCLLSWNHAAEEVYGYTKQEAIGASAYELIVTDETKKATDDVIQNVFKGKTIIGSEWQDRNKYGKIGWRMGNSFPLFKADGSVDCGVNLNIDITERRKVEEELRQERDKAQKYLDIAAVIFVALNKKGIVTLINQKGCEILNYDEKDIIGKNWFDNFLPKEDGKKVKSIFKKIMSGELLSVEYFENPILTKEGKIRQIAWHNTVLKSENGKIVGTLSSGGDVTERKKAEMALAESEQKFRKFFEYEPEYCYMVSPDGAILEINSAALNTLGYTREELIGKPIRDIYDPESQERMHKLFTQWKKAIEIRNEEMVIVTKNGDRRTVLLSASYVLDEDEKPRHSISIQRDITDRKLAQKALAKSESQYHSLIENIPGVVWTSDENGNTEFISSNVEKIYGFTSSEIYESSDQLWFGRIHPDDVNKVKKAYKHLFTKGESLNIEYRIKNKDGEWVWLQDRSIGAYEKKGVKYADGVFFDVTERKQAEEAMQKSSIIINSTTDAVICTDIAGNITLWNKGAEIIYGYRKEEILGKPISIIYKDEDMQVLDSMIAELMEGKNIPTIEVTCIGKNKKNIEILLSLTTITDNDGNIIELVGITKDITDRKQAEKKIHEHEEQLKSLTSELSLAEERERRRIAAGIHDDIAQRLALAKLELQTVQSTISDSNIISSLRNQCRTIDRIMEDARSLTFELSNHLLYEIGVEAAIESFLNEQIRKKSGIKCLFASEGPKIDLNEDIRIVLYQGVRELLTNTVKHAGASRVEVRIVKTDKQISVIVEDNGVGFDPVESDSTERDRGGFGLFNIRERLEFLGGNLSIHSESGKGTCITMSIPVKLQAIV